jgi:hypothetical protein
MYLRNVPVVGVFIQLIDSIEETRDESWRWFFVTWVGCSWAIASVAHAVSPSLRWLAGPVMLALFIAGDAVFYGTGQAWLATLDPRNWITRVARRIG